MRSAMAFAMAMVGLWLGLAGGVGAAQPVPAWAAEPPKDDAQSWFGIGEGPNFEAARRAGLRAVAAKLRSAVAGQVGSSVTEVNGKVDQRAWSAVSEDILRTEFTRFEVVQSAKGGAGVFALVKVDRAAFIADTRSQLLVADRSIREAEAALPTLSTLDQFVALRRLKPQIETGIRLSLLLQGAGEDEEGRAGARRYAGLMQAGDGLAARLTFEVRAPPSDTDLAQAMAAFLSEQGMRSAAGGTHGASALTLHSEGRQDELFGSKLLKLKVRVAVLDGHGRAAATREYDVSGSSRYDFKGARDDAVRKLGELWRKSGPVAALGFKE